MIWMGIDYSMYVNTDLFNRLIEALRDLEAANDANDPISADHAARKVATTATKLRQQVAYAVRNRTWD